MRWSVPSTLLLAVALLGLAPPASALVVCQEPARVFNTLQGPVTLDYDCPVFFDAFLVIAHNNVSPDAVVPGPGVSLVPAHFIACTVVDGVETGCEEACGSLLKQRVKGVEVRLHLALTLDVRCPTLAGEAAVIFADE